MGSEDKYATVSKKWEIPKQWEKVVLFLWREFSNYFQKLADIRCRSEA